MSAMLLEICFSTVAFGCLLLLGKALNFLIIFTESKRHLSVFKSWWFMSEKGLDIIHQLTIHVGTHVMPFELDKDKVWGDKDEVVERMLTNCRVVFLGVIHIHEYVIIFFKWEMWTLTNPISISHCAFLLLMIMSGNKDMVLHVALVG